MSWSTTSDVLAAKRKKESNNPGFAASVKSKEDNRASEAARTKLNEAEENLNRLREQPENPKVPSEEGEISKADGKAAFCLDDYDFEGLPVRYGRGMMGSQSCNYQRRPASSGGGEVWWAIGPHSAIEEEESQDGAQTNKRVGGQKDSRIGEAARAWGRGGSQNPATY